MGQPAVRMSAAFILKVILKHGRQAEKLAKELNNLTEWAGIKFLPPRRIVEGNTVLAWIYDPMQRPLRLPGNKMIREALYFRADPNHPLLTSYPATDIAVFYPVPTSMPGS